MPNYVYWTCLLASAVLGSRAQNSQTDLRPPSADGSPRSPKKNPLDSYMPPVDMSILPPTRPSLKRCRVEIIRHTFANSYGNPSQSKYLAPHDCIANGTIATAILNYQNQVQGTQFDRFGAVYIDKSEILRTTTAEPTQEGIIWHFEKDISHIIPLLYSHRDVTHILGNVVNNQYTGEFHVVASIDLYVESSPPSTSHQVIALSRQDVDPWYEINSETPLLHSFQVPRQSLARAELEVFVSGHNCDEFTYLNTPTDHARANDECEMGPFRELEVYLDDHFVGSVAPYPAIYTGGLSFSQWRPISGMGSFDLPTKVMNLAPYLSLLQDGTHTLRFHMKNATSMWFVTANLHLFASRAPIRTMLVDPVHRSSISTSIVENPKDTFKTVVSSKKSTLSLQSIDNNVVLTRLDSAIDFSHSIAFGLEKDFEVNCTSVTHLSTFRLGQNFNASGIANLWDLARPPTTSQAVSETYRLTGFYYLDYNLRKLNISLHSVTAARGIDSGLDGRGDWETELRLVGNSYVDNSDKNHPYQADNTIRGAVRHQKQPTGSSKSCYFHDLSAAHGDFTRELSSSACPSPPIPF